MLPHHSAASVTRVPPSSPWSHEEQALRPRRFLLIVQRPGLARQRSADRHDDHSGIVDLPGGLRLAELDLPAAPCSSRLSPLPSATQGRVLRETTA
ncbi:Hypothetical protein RADP37_05263 [Roseomonas mucosa]|uniref:Uncharacterized protein n=1 Tax=Roseomonas mucosa TaxID=207340 RepID=A0A4Y1N3C9_9PROT|nr:Hypothetical protein RADP37_05263 [Roseomonas mucosa]